MQLGSVIQGSRKARKLSLDQVAKASGVSSAMISLVERGLGNPSYVTLMKLATALDVKPEELFIAAGEAPQGTAPVRATRKRAAGAPDPNHKAVPAAASAVRILKYLGERNEPAGVTQVARDLGLNVSTCLNLLRTLVAAEMVYLDPRFKTYSLGFGVVDLAAGALRNLGVLGALLPGLRRLARERAVTTSVWRRTRTGRLVLVSGSQGDDPLSIHLTIGQRMPLYAGAAGRCMAAQADLSEAELRQAFDALRWDGEITFERYLEEVRQAKIDQYAIDDGVLQAPILAVGSAINDPDGRPVMALSAAMFRAPGAMAVARELAPELASLAGSITRAAGVGLVDLSAIADLALT